MRAISLHQPHASFIALGYKPYETRSWATKYRGPLLIHAAQRKMNSDDRALWFYVTQRSNWDEAPLGAFVCCVNLVACIPTEKFDDVKRYETNDLGNFDNGRFAWELDDCKRFGGPSPSIGRQRFCNYELNRIVGYYPQRWIDILEI